MTSAEEEILLVLDSINLKIYSDVKIHSDYGISFRNILLKRRESECWPSYFFSPPFPRGVYTHLPLDLVDKLGVFSDTDIAREYADQQFLELVKKVQENPNAKVLKQELSDRIQDENDIPGFCRREIGKLRAILGIAKRKKIGKEKLAYYDPILRHQYLYLTEEKGVEEMKPENALTENSLDEPKPFTPTQLPLLEEPSLITQASLDEAEVVVEAPKREFQAVRSLRTLQKRFLKKIDDEFPRLSYRTVDSILNVESYKGYLIYLDGKLVAQFTDFFLLFSPEKKDENGDIISLSDGVVCAFNAIIFTKKKNVELTFILDEANNYKANEVILFDLFVKALHSIYWVRSDKPKPEGWVSTNHPLDLSE